LLRQLPAPTEQALHVGCEHFVLHHCAQARSKTVLNIVFLMLAAVLVLRFLRTGGPAMLRMMNTPEEEMAQHDQGMVGMEHYAMGHGTGMAGMGHAGHAGDATAEHEGPVGHEAH
jgi:uncharacterized protein